MASFPEWKSAPTAVGETTKNGVGRSGAKTDTKRWEKFAAALAVLFENGGLDLSSENRAHNAVATFLAERGHEDALSVDTVRPLIRRLMAWKDGHPFTDDADYSEQAD